MDYTPLELYEILRKDVRYFYTKRNDETEEHLNDEDKLLDIYSEGISNDEFDELINVNSFRL